MKAITSKVALFWVAAMGLGCKGQQIQKAEASSSDTAFIRDFVKYPPLFDLRQFNGTLYVIGDVHGSFTQMLSLLKAAGVAGGTEVAPEWRAGKGILVSVGDLINKGAQSIPTLKYMMNLQKAAEKSGGKVVVLPGNHEVGFIVDPKNRKAAELKEEARGAKLDMIADLHSPRSPIGSWLRNLPMAARIGQVFLSHSGYLREDLDTTLEKYRTFINNNSNEGKFACGDKTGSNRYQDFFNAGGWWGKDAAEFFKVAQRAGAKQIVFGHDPAAFGEKGAIRGFLKDNANHALIKVDVGLVTGESRGELLICEKWNSDGSCFAFSTFKMTGTESGVKTPLVIESSKPPKQAADPIEDEC